GHTSANGGVGQQIAYPVNGKIALGNGRFDAWLHIVQGSKLVCVGQLEHGKLTNFCSQIANLTATQCALTFWRAQQPEKPPTSDLQRPSNRPIEYTANPPASGELAFLHPCELCQAFHRPPSQTAA